MKDHTELVATVRARQRAIDTEIDQLREARHAFEEQVDRLRDERAALDDEIVDAFSRQWGNATLVEMADPAVLRQAVTDARQVADIAAHVSFELVEKTRAFYRSFAPSVIAGHALGRQIVPFPTITVNSGQQYVEADAGGVYALADWVVFAHGDDVRDDFTVVTPDGFVQVLVAYPYAELVLLVDPAQDRALVTSGRRGEGRDVVFDGAVLDALVWMSTAEPK